MQVTHPVPGSGPRCLLMAMAALCGISLSIAAQSPSVQAAVSATQTEIGVPFTLQISLDGSDTEPQVELPALDDVSIRQVSAGPNNSQSITIINGQTTRRVQRGYIIRYEVIAFRAGRVEIPSIYVTVDGRRLATDLLAVTIVKSPSIVEYLLLIELSTDHAWVGQPVTLTTTWMWKEGLGPQRVLSFSHPVMRASNADVVILPSEGKATELMVAGTNLMATPQALLRDGKAHQALGFEMILFPRESGLLEVPAATISFEGIASFRTRRDVFGRTVREIRRLVVSSEALEIRVAPLPAAGQPDGFSGLVGTFEITATAAPAIVKVGDPIALEITVNGLGDLSSLTELDLVHFGAAGDFRVAAQRVDRSPGQFPSGATFRTTLRALHESVTVVPPVGLSYFDSQRGAYAEVVSAPIALEVQPARQVTLRDVEGSALPEDEGAGLFAAAAGIAHNYEGERLLRRQRFDTAAFVRSWGGALLLAAGPLAVGIGTIWMRLRMLVAATPGSRGALTRLRREIADSGGDAAGMAAALYEYLRVRLGTDVMPTGPNLLAETLQGRGVGLQQVDELREVLEGLDASRYGGVGDSMEALNARILRWAETVDWILAREGGA